jgi:hypothetical protein
MRWEYHGRPELLVVFFPQFPNVGVLMNLLTFSRLWRAGRALSLAIMTISFAHLLAPNGQGQTGQASQEHDRTGSSVPASGGAGQTAPLAPPAGKAMVYVYRPSNHDKDVQLPIYLNGYYVITLEPSTYANGVVPQGKLVVAAIDSKSLFYSTYERTGRWLTLPGCGTLDQKRLDSLGEVAEKQQADLARCKRSLSEILVMIGNSQSGGAIPAEMIRACNFSGGYNQLDLTNCDAEMDGALNFVNQTVGGSYVPPPRITIDVEAGKTYYLRWTRYHNKSDKIEVVDSATGANETSKLQRTTAR